MKAFIGAAVAAAAITPASDPCLNHWCALHVTARPGSVVQHTTNQQIGKKDALEAHFQIAGRNYPLLGTDLTVLGWNGGVVVRVTAQHRRAPLSVSAMSLTSRPVRLTVWFKALR